MGYGFCLEDNPCDVVSFRLAQLPDAIAKKLKDKGIETGGEFYLRGRNYVNGGYDSEHACFRAFPPALVRIALELAVIQREGSSQPLDSRQASWGITIAAARLLLNAVTRERAAKCQDEQAISGAWRECAKNAAQTYTRSQYRIYNEAVEDLQESLKIHKGVTPYMLFSGNAVGLLTLSEALSTAAEYSDEHDTFIEGVEATIGSLDTHLESGNDDLAWYLFLGYLRIMAGQGQLTADFLSAWLENVSTDFPGLDQPEPSEDESVSDVLRILDVAREGFPNTSWASSQWTPLLIAWSMHVIRSESMTIDDEGLRIPFLNTALLDQKE